MGRMRPESGSAHNMRLHLHVTDRWCLSVACILKIETGRKGCTRLSWLAIENRGPIPKM
jgi:hypothetical protein